MFQIKICGVTNPDDAIAVLDAGAGAIGLNFYASSPRGISRRQATAIAEAVGNRAVKVGVFVNAPSIDIRQAAQECGLDAVQLHGDEPPESLAELGGLKIIRAFRLGGSAESAAHYLDACARLDARPSMALVDAVAPGVYGGSGREADWGMLVRQRAAFRDLPLILAGGLDPDNVAAAIEQVRPVAVDVASGVEDRPGRKSAARMRAFVAAARSAFEVASNAE